MNIQTKREQIATALEGIKPSGWVVTSETFPDIHSGTIQVGHAALIEPLSYTRWGVEIPITVWVDETEDNSAISAFYALFSPGVDSIITKLNATDLFQGPVVFDGAEPRRGPQGEGANMFLAGDLRVRVLVQA